MKEADARVSFTNDCIVSIFIAPFILGSDEQQSAFAIMTFVCFLVALMTTFAVFQSVAGIKHSFGIHGRVPSCSLNNGYLDYSKALPETDEKVVLLASYNATSAQAKSNSTTPSTLPKGKGAMFGNVLENIDIFKRGFSELIPSFKTAWRLRQKSKREGILSLTYEETKKMEIAQSDAMGLVSKAFYLSMAKQWFLYSNVLMPLISSNNPWLWVQSFPSVFDSPKYKAMRERILQQRRHQALVGALEQLQSEATEDKPAKQRQDRLEQVAVITEALNKKSSSLAEAYSVLEPWLIVPNNQYSLKSIRLSSVPGKVVKDFLRSTGTDGLPNLPILHTFNRGPFRKYFESLMHGDDFLMKKGVQNLTPGDVSFLDDDSDISTEDNSRRLRMLPM